MIQRGECKQQGGRGKKKKEVKEGEAIAGAGNRLLSAFLSSSPPHMQQPDLGRPQHTGGRALHSCQLIVTLVCLSFVCCLLVLYLFVCFWFVVCLLFVVSLLNVCYLLF